MSKVVLHIVNKSTGVILQTYFSNRKIHGELPSGFAIVKCKAGCNVKR
jgi:hypothetical protein